MSKFWTQKIVKTRSKISLHVICLPTETDFEDFDKTKCAATGWGKDSFGK